LATNWPRLTTPEPSKGNEMAIDWTDPCQRAAALRNAYYDLLSGSMETLVRNKGPDGERESRYAQADIARLKAELDAAEEACLLASGQSPAPRRHAITLGARGRRSFYCR
jgi:hypothetical protein